MGEGEEGGNHGLDEEHDSPLFIRVSKTDVHLNGLLAWVTCQEHRSGGKLNKKKKVNSNLQGLAMLEQYFESEEDEDDEDEEAFLSGFGEDDDEEEGFGMKVLGSGGDKEKETKEETFFATNIYRKFNGKWRLISHHSGSDGIPFNERSTSTVQRLEQVLGGENTKISVIPSSALSDGFNNIQGQGNNGFDNNNNNNENQNQNREDSFEAILDHLKSAIEDKLEERNQALNSYKDWLPGHQTDIVRTGRYYPDNSGLSMGKPPSSSSSSSSKRSNNRSKKNIKKAFPQKNNYTMKNNSNNNDNNNKKKKNAENRLTKRTLSAIRRLFADKRITLSQKRKLIHNVIQCTSIEETSQVELAYELLVENALAGEENAMDEFADQCRIIAEDHRNGSYEADD